MNRLRDSDPFRDFAGQLDRGIRTRGIWQGLGMTKEGSLAKMDERPGRPPVALLIGGKNIPFPVRADTAG